MGRAGNPDTLQDMAWERTRNPSGDGPSETERDAVRACAASERIASWAAGLWNLIQLDFSGLDKPTDRANIEDARRVLDSAGRLQQRLSSRELVPFYADRLRGRRSSLHVAGSARNFTLKSDQDRGE